MAAVAATTHDFAGRTREAAGRLFAAPRVREAAMLAGLVVFGLAWGALVAMAGLGAALLCVSMIAGLYCLVDFRAGVTLLIIIMPISSSVLFPHAMFGMTGLNPLNLLLAITLAVYLMSQIGHGALQGLVPRPLLWLYIVPFVAGGLIGMQHVSEIPMLFRATDMVFFDTPASYLRDMVMKPLNLVVYAILVGAAVGRSKQPEKFVTPMFLSVFAMAALAITFVVTSGVGLSQLAGTYSRQFFSQLGMHANDLGRLYAVAYALLLFVWDRSDRLALKAMLVVAMGLVTLALVLTFSRGAFLGFLIVNLIYLASRRSLKTFALAAVLIPIGLAFAPGAIWSRLQAGVGQGLDEITAGRLDDIWIPIMPEVLATPPWGNGLGAVMWSKAMRFEEMFFVTHPHNAYLQAYLDLGAIGTLLLVAFWAYSWASFRGLARDKRITPELQGFFEGAAAGVVSFLVAGIAGSSLMPVPEQSFLWLALGVMWGVRRHLAREGG
jgi:O-antigen ligase